MFLFLYREGNDISFPICFLICHRMAGMQGFLLAGTERSADLQSRHTMTRKLFLCDSAGVMKKKQRIQKGYDALYRLVIYILLFSLMFFGILVRQFTVLCRVHNSAVQLRFSCICRSFLLGAGTLLPVSNASFCCRIWDRCRAAF